MRLDMLWCRRALIGATAGLCAFTTHSSTLSGAAAGSPVGSASVPSVTLNTGRTMPAIGFGTYLTGGDELYDALLTALKAGYRHIDTAAGYRSRGRANERNHRHRFVS